MAGDDDKIFMTRSLNVTPKTTEQRLIVRNDKSVAYVASNKRLRSTFCTTDRQEASRGLFATLSRAILVNFDGNECRVLSLSDCKYSLSPLSQTQID